MVAMKIVANIASLVPLLAVAAFVLALGPLWADGQGERRTSRGDGVPEIVVDGQTGYLVPPADPAALGSRLSDLLSDPYKARQMGENGRVRLEQTFSVANMVRDTLKVYGAT